mmetsp:Transcript_24080/g.52123  ORF Transcript_24080/g.52123 Transcript_24080/m.52123 type:complete len:251 (-) Transcript_24080:57-809(-)
MVCASLGLHEYQHQPLGRAAQKLHHIVYFVVLLHPLQALRHVLGRGTHPPHGQEDILLHEIARQSLDLHGEGGGEHESLPLPRHSLLLHDFADLRLEAHVEHSVRLVQHQEAHDLQPHPAPLDEVHQPARGGHQDVGAAVQLALLVLDVCAAVHTHGADAGAVGELNGLLEYLHSQLARGGQDKRADVGAPAAVLGLLAGPVAQHGGDQGEEEAGRLAGPRLRAGHHVPAPQADGDGVLLHGGGFHVLGE